MLIVGSQIKAPNSEVMHAFMVLRHMHDVYIQTAIDAPSENRLNRWPLTISNGLYMYL